MGTAEGSAPRAGWAGIDDDDDTTKGSHMATVRMLATVTGTRNGVPWPAIGETTELPDHEAAVMAGQNLVEIVDAPKPKPAAKKPAAKKRGAGG